MATYGIMVGMTIVVYLLSGIQTGMNSNEQRRRTITTFFFIYIILLCLRDISVGVDTKGYIAKYFIPNQGVHLFDGLNKDILESGFLILTRVMTHFHSYHLYISVIAIITVVPIMMLYRNECEAPMFCIAFFLISLLFEMFFSGMRQGIAIGFAVPAFYCTKERKWLSFFVIVFLATLFHSSGIMLLLLFPVFHAKITKKWLYFVIPLLIIVYYYKSIIFSYLLLMVGGNYIDKYNYLTTSSSGQTGLMLLFIIFCIYSFFLMDEELMEHDDIGARNLLLLATTLQLFATLNPVVSRLNYYYILFIPIAMSKVHIRCKRRYVQVERIASFIMPTYFIFYFFFIKTDSLQVFDYKFFF